MTPGSLPPPTPGLSRREWLVRFGMGLGGVALADLLGPTARAQGGFLGSPHHRPRARRVIFLFQAGAPSQLDLFDPKPLLREKHGTQLPEEVRQGQRLTGMSGHQSSLPLVGSPFSFAQHGESGAWFSELLPHTARLADRLCIVRSMVTEAINHGPGVTHLQTGSPLPGRPSIGAWLDYGLGSDHEDLPSFVVLVTKDKGGQPLFSRLWGSGFLPARHQGVRLRAAGQPVLYLANPDGVDRASRRAMLDRLRELHEHARETTGDAALEDRIAQHELAFRMQASVPAVADLSQEPDAVVAEYGEDARTPGTYAAHCLLARRLVERGVRFVQLYHQGWDHHSDLPAGIRTQCRETDQPTAALLRDLERRGLLEDTLVLWGGEFGRTNYCQGHLTADHFGRDHHPRCFTLWLAGGGVRAGTTVGATDDYGYRVVRDPVRVHDLQATILHLLGIDHERLTFQHQGRRFRLTDVDGAVVAPILA